MILVNPHEEYISMEKVVLRHQLRITTVPDMSRSSRYKKKRRAMNRQKHSATPGEEEEEPPEGGEYEPGTPLDDLPGDETDFEDDGHGAPEDAAEGDEDDIEIDVVEGEVQGSQKRDTQERS